VFDFSANTLIMEVSSLQLTLRQVLIINMFKIRHDDIINGSLSFLTALGFFPFSPSTDSPNPLDVRSLKSSSKNHEDQEKDNMIKSHNMIIKLTCF
jgi:hypothetical protein